MIDAYRFDPRRGTVHLVVLAASGEGMSEWASAVGWSVVGMACVVAVVVGLWPREGSG